MTYVRERYHPKPMTANSSAIIKGVHMGGFAAKTNGTITVTDNDGTVLVDAHPVTAGIYMPLPFVFSSSEGATVTLAGGASGTLAV